MPKNTSAQRAFHNATQNQPPARKGGCMAYDEKRALTLLFGGGGLNDTWSWDGATWSQLQPAQSPAPRISACMAYDTERESIVLFGGVSNTGLPLGDTWLWDGATWTRRTPPLAPGPRGGAAMAYSEEHKGVILFGGEAFNGRVGTLLQDTWLWNGTNWQQQSLVQAPEVRVGANLASTPQQNIVLFGGSAGTMLYADTWTLSAAGWKKLNPPLSPPARAWANLLYDAQGQTLILVGGSDLVATANDSGLSDVWRWDGQSWSQVIEAQAPAGGYHSAAYDSVRSTIVLYASRSNKVVPGDKKSGTQNKPFTSPVVLTGDLWLWPSQS